MNRTPVYATATTGITVPRQRPAPAPVVRDLRDRAYHGPRTLRFDPATWS